MFINLWCHFLDNVLVTTSATMCSVGQYSNQTSPFSTCSWAKWCCTSMCLVHAWWVGFLVNDIAPWLSHRITITFFSSMYPKSIINFVIHMAYFVACVFTMYSTSVVDNVIVGCRLLLQEMAPPPIMKTNLVVDFLFSRSPPQIASQYPNTSLDGVASNYNFICNVPCKYRKIHLTAIQCSMLGLAKCWLNTFIGYAKLSRVHNMAYIKDPTTCWYGNPFDSSFPLTFLCNFTLGSNGTPMGLHSSIQKHFNTSLRYLIWLMCRSCSSWFLSTSIPKKKCNSPRSFISNFWLSFFFVCKSLF